jgi:hypothetical protein
MSESKQILKPSRPAGRGGSPLERLIAETLAIETESAREAGALGYMARALVQATMPHKRTAGEVFLRRNGQLTLRMMADPEVGLPYGTLPRLLVAWLTTEAARTKERTLVMGPTLSAFMAKLDLTPSGGARGDSTRLKEQLQRTFSCAIACLYNAQEYQAYMRFALADQYILWWDKKRPDEVTWQSTVTLGERFFEEAVGCPVPVDMRVLKALTRSPLAIDIYTWLSYRMSYLKRRTAIPWGALQAQFGSDYPLTARGRRNFKSNFLQQLRKVHVLYPMASFEMTEGCLILLPGKPHVSPRLAARGR